MATECVSVLLFAQARQLAGTGELPLPVSAGTTVGDVRKTLAERFPALKELAPRLLAAVNASYAQESTPVKANDTVAFFPPVSGG
jgi:molybdopterin converting factor subunit 1